MKRVKAPKPPYQYMSVEELTIHTHEHEINFFAGLTTNKASYNPGDVYRGKWDNIPEVLFKALELEKIQPLRQYVLIYKPKGDYSRTF